MKILIDADNGPHALIIAPIREIMLRRGHDVVVTARDRTNTLQLLSLYGIPHIAVGGEYAPSMVGKIRGTIGRAWSLSKQIRRHQPDVTFGHGSRALPLASQLTSVPSVTMYDYEWVNAALFNRGCRTILLPDCITDERIGEAGIDPRKAQGYPGFKENIYLSGHQFEPGVAEDLGLDPDRVAVLLRPPATTAHYHNPEAEILFTAILKKLAASPEVQVVMLARTPDQVRLANEAGIADLIVPKRVYDGPSLIAVMDLMISGGGTMTREAAILGVPSYSFFRGRSGLVDQTLESQGRLILLSAAGEVPEKLMLRKKPSPAVAPKASKTVEFIVDAIIAAAS